MQSLPTALIHRQTVGAMRKKKIVKSTEKYFLVVTAQFFNPAKHILRLGLLTNDHITATIQIFIASNSQNELLKNCMEITEEN